MVKKLQKKPDGIRRLRKQSRDYSIKEGIFAKIRFSLGNEFISPFAIAINASNPLVAMLSAFSGLLGPLGQLQGSKLIGKYPRKKILYHSIVLETLIWVPLIIIAILFAKGLFLNLLPFFLLFFFGIYIILSNFGHPAWFSWMGDIVNKNKRGRYFAKRNLLTGIVGVVIAIFAGMFLDYLKYKNLIMLGFVILFILTIIAEIFRLKSLKQQYEPKIQIKKGDYFSFWEFIKKAPKNNFGKFTIFRLLFTLTGYIYVPLLSIYLLRELEFSYFLYMVIILSGTVFSLFFLELWGKFTDKYGNYKTLIITTIILPIIPLLWILNSSPIYLILIPSAITGIIWAGYSLAETNFIYDNVKDKKRGLAVSYFNIMWGIGAFTGGIISAILIKYLTVAWIKPLFLIFFISAIARMIIVFFWIPKLKEIRKTKKLKGMKSFEELIIKEGKATLIEEIHQIRHINDYIFKNH